MTEELQLTLDLDLLNLNDWIFIEDLSVGGFDIKDRPFSKMVGMMLRLGGDPEVIGTLTLDQAIAAILDIGGTVQDTAVNPPSDSDSDSGPEESDTDPQPGAES
ncbi:hypothetical protein CMI37_13145 [Candidatus Pacearchaeota archaeon]|nr:hypothetical protein [Candidatus Pacearchaeota archaeon]|tara:strand:+ start:1630 stop:1941 length:312 start_codon:yes stop_codon:yes gene_type:complete